MKPEAFAPNNLWTLTGRRFVRRAIERERPDVVVATSPPPSGLFATAAVGRRDAARGRRARSLGRQPVLRPRKPRHGRPAGVGARPHRRGRNRHRRVPRELCSPSIPRSPVACRSCPTASTLCCSSGASHQRRTTGPRGSSTPARSTASTTPSVWSKRWRRSPGRARLELVGVVDPRTRRAVAAATHAEVVIDPPVSWEEADRASARGRHRRRDHDQRRRGRHGAAEQALRGARARPAGARARRSSAATPPGLLQRLGQGTGIAPPDDPAAISAAIERLLADPPPPVEAEALQDFDRDRVAARYAALLDEVAMRSSAETSSGTTTSRR